MGEQSWARARQAGLAVESSSHWPARFATLSIGREGIRESHLWVEKPSVHHAEPLVFVSGRL